MAQGWLCWQLRCGLGLETCLYSTVGRKHLDSRASTPAKVNGHVYKMVLGSRERSHEAHVVESSKSKSLRDAGNLIRG